MKTKLAPSFYATRVTEPLRTLATQAEAALKILVETPPPQFAVQNLARGKVPILPQLKSIAPTSLDWDKRAAGVKIDVTGKDLQDVEEFALVPAQDLADKRFTAKANSLSKRAKESFSAQINVTNAPAGTYHAWVRNKYGQEDLLLNQLTIHPAQAPSITTQPVAATVNLGASASFTVLASGTGPLNYQWRKNGMDIPGAKLATLTIPSASASDAGNYDVKVGNAAGSMTSGSAQLTVNSKPRITTHPTSLSVAENTDAAFFVKATSTDSLKYQWLKNDVELPGECSDILHLKNVKCFQAGKYKVIVTNSAGTDCCDAELSVFTPKHK